MSYRDRTTIEPGKRGGKPCICGQRITVGDILEYLAGGMTEAGSGREQRAGDDLPSASNPRRRDRTTRAG
jgi:hypothetical protein